MADQELTEAQKKAMRHSPAQEARMADLPYRVAVFEYRPEMRRPNPHGGGVTGMAKTADEILASKSVAELKAGLKRGIERLRLVDALQGMDVSEEFDGPFPPTKTFETWAAQHHERETRLLLLGMADVRRELARRAALMAAE